MEKPLLRIKMTEKSLDERFQIAVAAAAEMTQSSLPQDVQLRLYAFYKHATAGIPSPNFNIGLDLRSAFKTNAWMQIRHLSVEEAKEQYIELINSLVNNP